MRSPKRVRTLGIARWSLILLCLILPGATEAHRRLPRFHDYPASSIYSGKPAPLKSQFRNVADKTNIKLAAQGKADFAGHYIVAIGSCGASCCSLAVIDARKGM